MRTIGRSNTIREWEFKLEAGHKALGQVLTYMTQARLELGEKARIEGVIAAFTFEDFLQTTITTERLHIELVTLPEWIDNAGKATDLPKSPLVSIPQDETSN